LPSWFYKIIPTEKVHLGLDLQGGMHLILEVQAEKAVESYVERVKNNLRDDLRDKAVPVGKLEREKSNQIVLEVSGEKGKWEKILSQRYGFMQELSSTALDKGIWRVVLVLDSRQAEQIRKGAIDQALETIRNRIDQFGVAEPEITLQ
jgi:preprotein translocase subunit SecD